MPTPTKPDYTLLPKAGLDLAAAALQSGAAKYSSPVNWRGQRQRRDVLASALRHIHAYLAGEDTDPESGVCHLGHAAADVLIAGYFHAKGTRDDRFPSEGDTA